MQYQAIIVGNAYNDELLVFGWMREVCKLLTFEIFPNEVMKLIQRWVVHRDLHLIALTRVKDVQHWKMNLNKILLD